MCNGAPKGIRTPGLLLRRQLLYPAELLAQKQNLTNGAGDGNRTHATSLEGWSSTIELHPHLSDDFYFNINYMALSILISIFFNFYLFTNIYNKTANKNASNPSKC